jgi:phosphatidylglycerol lysyltransferase
MGRLEAFVSFHAGADRWSLDLIRHRPDAPDGCVAALILSALGQAARQRIGCLSLASCPLPGFGLTGLAGNWAEQLAIKGGAAGLRQFKGMFAPVRTRLYLAAPTDAGVLIAAAEVARAIRWPGALPHGCSPPAAKLSALHVTADKLAFESFPRA